MAERDDALARLKMLVQADSRPALTAPELAAILDAHPAPDADGMTKADGMEWRPTYDLNAAAAEGWRIKGGKVAGDFNFTADSAQYAKGDVMAHCLAMEQKYASMAHGSASTAPHPLTDLGGLVING